MEHHGGEERDRRAHEPARDRDTPAALRLLASHAREGDLVLGEEGFGFSLQRAQETDLPNVSRVAYLDAGALDAISGESAQSGVMGPSTSAPGKRPWLAMSFSASASSVEANA